MRVGISRARRFLRGLQLYSKGTPSQVEANNLTTKARNSGTLLKLNLSKVKSCNFAKARTLQVY